MGTTADKLEYLTNNIDAIKQGLTNKGVNMTIVNLADYSSKISGLATLPSKIPVFNDDTIFQYYEGNKLRGEYYSLLNYITEINDFVLHGDMYVASGFFNSLFKLQTINGFSAPDLTNASNFFQGIYASTITNINMPKVTNLQFTFQFSKLVTAPDLNLSNVTTTNSMFSSNSLLKNVPKYNFNPTYISSMYSNCPLLTNESLNNILYFISINTNVEADSKVIRYIGLDSTQLEICKTLSYYQSCINNGWVLT